MHLPSMSLGPESLPQAWRARAESLRDWGGSVDAARLWERAATELDQALASAGNDTLTLKEAAKLTGLTAGHLGDLVRAGRLANAGRKHAPRVRRSDLPAVKKSEPERQPRHAVATRVDLATVVRRRRSS